MGESVRENAILDGSGLPPEIRSLLRRIVAGSELRGEARIEVLRELVTHFEDGLAGGIDPQQLLQDFGDPEELIRLIRRTKRGRSGVPLWGSVGRMAEWVGPATQDLRLSFRGLRKSPA